MKYNEDCAGTAAQIVFEYPGWSDEHISDMWKAVLDSSGAPRDWGEDTLFDATFDAQWLKDKGYSYEDTVEILTKGTKQGKKWRGPIWQTRG